MLKAGNFKFGKKWLFQWTKHENFVLVLELGISLLVRVSIKHLTYKAVIFIKVIILILFAISLWQFYGWQSILEFYL